MQQSLRCGIGLALVAGGCAQWPRYAHPPNDRSVSASTVVDVTWSALGDEEELNDWPDDPGVLRAAISKGEGVTASGALDGVGYGGGSPLLRGDSDCTHGPAQRYPLPDGEYTGDVDVLVVDLSEAGRLCVTAELASELAFDLLLLPLDACDLPGAPEQRAGDILGLARGGTSARWDTAVESGRYAVQLAAWDPNDPGLTVPWSLAVSLVQGACSEEIP